MIKVTLEALPEAAQNRIRKWLLQPECRELEQAVRSEMAFHESQSVELAMQDFVTVAGQKTLPPTSGVELLKAMQCHIFLLTLDNVGRPDYVFRKATMTLETKGK